MTPILLPLALLTGLSGHESQEMPWFYELAKPYAVRPKPPRKPKNSNRPFQLLTDEEFLANDRKFMMVQKKAGAYHDRAIVAMRAGKKEETLQLLRQAHKISPISISLFDYDFALLAFNRIQQLRKEIGTLLAKWIWTDPNITFEQAAKQFKFSAKNPYLYLSAFLVSLEPGDYPELDLSLSSEIWRIYRSDANRLEFFSEMSSKRLNWTLILLNQSCPGWLRAELQDTLLSYGPRNVELLLACADQALNQRDFARAASYFRRAAAAHTDSGQISILFSKYIAAKERIRLKPSPTASTPLTSVSPDP